MSRTFGRLAACLGLAATLTTIILAVPDHPFIFPLKLMALACWFGAGWNLAALRGARQ